MKLIVLPSIIEQVVSLTTGSELNFVAKELFMHTIVQSIELIGSVGMTLCSHVARIHGAAAPHVDHFLADRRVHTAGTMPLDRQWETMGR